MISNHYGALVQSRWNWLALILLMAAGAVIRLFFVMRHNGPSRWELVAVGLALIVAGAWLVAPASVASTTASIPPREPANHIVAFARVKTIIVTRCVACHNSQLASKNVRLDSDDEIVDHARDIEQQVVLQKTMPLNNATVMSDEERATLARWIAAGAPRS